MMMILIKMTFITVADNDGAVAVDNGDYLFIYLFI